MILKILQVTDIIIGGRLMRKLKYRLSMWMRGRYGYDEFSKALNYFAVIMFVLSVVFGIGTFYAVGVIAVFYSLYRTCSRNIGRMNMERKLYLKAKAKVIGTFNVNKRRFKERKTHKYHKCPFCKTYNRVPRGHGRVLITCPKCGTSFERRV